MKKAHLRQNINCSFNRCHNVGSKHCYYSIAFFEYFNDMDNIYKKLFENNPNIKRKILIVFDDMIVDILSNKKVQPIVTEGEN